MNDTAAARLADMLERGLIRKAITADLQHVLDELDTAQGSLDAAWGREMELKARITELEAEVIP